MFGGVAVSIDISPLSIDFPFDESDFRPGPVLELLPPLDVRSEYERTVKPVLDFMVAAVLLLLFAPVLAAVALAVRLQLGKGVLFLQQRVGLDGQPFTVYKFRTMRHDRRAADRSFAGTDRRQAHKCDDDPRHTSLGRLLRKLSLDELPQLVNVLRGEMSIVGPRPELVSVVAAYEPWQHRRHRVKPGLTGLWQVTTRGQGRLMKDDTQVDLDYVECISLRTDATILVKTVPVLVFGRTGS
jgi:lipopolysaccharide/colanic/teichoic acid biosynthesis glycosyltransferase